MKPILRSCRRVPRRDAIEENFKHLNVWLPSKDTGVDILVTDKANRRTLSMQVKFSKDSLGA